jgi:hypothetical protein
MRSAAMTKAVSTVCVCVYRLVNVSHEDSNWHLVGNTIAHYMSDIGLVC